MLALGLLSVAQAALLPGLILVLLLRLGDGLLRMFALAFAFSVLINYLIVVALAVCGGYSPAAMYALSAAEIVGLAVIIRRRGAGTPLRNDLDRLGRIITRIAAHPPARRLFGATIGVAAIYVWGACVTSAFSAAGSVFSEWDAVVSWNKWATQWFSEGAPSGTLTYPQLLPAIYSVTYQFIGTADVQFFAMALTGLFPLAMLAAMTDLALRLDDLRYLAAAAAARTATVWVLGSHSMSGFADEPVACLIVLAVYSLICAHEQPADRVRLLLVGALCAAAAGATKQTAWGLCIVLPLLCLLAMHGDHQLSRARRIRLAAALALIPVICVAPWYLYCWLSGFNWGIGYIAVGIHKGRGPVERADFALERLSSILGLPTWMTAGTLVIAAVLALADRTWRWIWLLVALPVSVLWLQMLGYTARNLTPAIPLLVTGACVGFGSLLRLMGVRAPVRPRPAIGYTLWALGCVTLIVVVAHTRLRASVLRRASDQQRSGAFNVEINRALYEYSASAGFGGKILTNYQILGFLPGLSQLYRFHGFDSDAGINAALADPAISHLLFYGHSRAPPTLQRQADRGVLVQVAVGRRFCLYRVVRGAVLPSLPPPPARAP